MEFIKEKVKAYVEWSKHPVLRHDKACRVRSGGRGGSVLPAAPRRGLGPTEPTGCTASAHSPAAAAAPRSRAPPQYGDAGDVEGSNKKLYAALIAEFLGLLLFQLYGGEVRGSAAVKRPFYRP